MVADRAVFVIAEAGVNHNGRLDLALQLVDAAAQAGADAVKFQTFVPEALVAGRAAKARYQKETTGDAGSQLEMLRALMLSRADHHALVERCRSAGIEFLSTPFDRDSLAFLTGELGLPRIKLASGELTNGPLLWQAARSNLPVILSTGMGTLDEVRTALGVLALSVWLGYLRDEPPASGPACEQVLAGGAARQMLRDKVTLLHCTTEYPCPFEDVNLRAMDTLAAEFGLPVGYSDHTPGITVPVAAVARGACLIEKHLTLDRTLPGPDHRASLEPDELRAMVAAIRQAEAAMGNGIKEPAPAEMENRPVARRSLVAARPIAAGEPFSDDNLTAKRPADGLSPMHYWSLLGRPSTRAYASDEPIAPCELD